MPLKYYITVIGTGVIIGLVPFIPVAVPMEYKAALGGVMASISAMWHLYHESPATAKGAA